MPHDWHRAPDGAEILHLQPHHALAPKGFAWFIGVTSALAGLPLLAVLGSPVLWALLPFPILAVTAIWYALRRNTRDRSIRERLEITPERIWLQRQGPKGQVQDWQANPRWVRLERHLSAGPVPDYLTLTGGQRVAEIGAFLTPEERRALQGEIEARLRNLR